MRPRISIKGMSVRPSVRNAFVSNTRKRVILASEVEGREEGRGEGGRRGEEKEGGGVRGGRGRG